MKKRLGAAVVALMMLLVPILAQAEVMYVNTPNGGGVNLREGPSADDAILTSVCYGAAVDVIGFLLGSDWVNVNYNGYFGYISMRYLSDYPPTPGPFPTFVPAPTYAPYPTYVPAPTSRPAPAPTKKPPVGGSSLEKTLSQMYAGFKTSDYQAVVVPSTPTNYVNLRWAPSTSAPVRAQYWAGNTLQVLSTSGEWAEVYDAATNTYGYMMLRFLRSTGVGIGGGADS